MSNAISTTNQNAVATVKSLMSSDAAKAKFNELLGKKAAGFISSVITASNSSALVGANPTTIVNAAVVAASLDLPIDNNLGFAYIVPYNDKNKGKQGQFQMGYKGFIQLAMRSGQYQTINATDIREGEIVDEDLLSGEITFKKLPSDKRINAKVIGYAAFFRLINGFTKTLYMSKEEVEAHAKQYSQSYKFDKYNSSLWATQFDTMAKKTVLKLLISKYGPLSIEMQNAQKFDQAVVKDSAIEADNLTEVEVEYIDNEPVAETPSDAVAQKMNAIKDKVAQAASRKAAVEEASLGFENAKD